jgi:hypothetical protein
VLFWIGLVLSPKTGAAYIFAFRTAKDGGLKCNLDSHLGREPASRHALPAKLAARECRNHRPTGNARPLTGRAWRDVPGGAGSGKLEP